MRYNPLGAGEDYYDGRSNAFVPENTWLSKDQALMAMQRQHNDGMARATQQYNQGFITAPMLQTLHGVMANQRLTAAASLNFNGMNSNWLNTAAARRNISGYGAPFELRSWSIGSGGGGEDYDDEPAPSPRAPMRSGSPFRPWNPDGLPTQWGKWAPSNAHQARFPGLAHESQEGIRNLTPSIPPKGRIAPIEPTTDGHPAYQLQEMRNSIRQRVQNQDMAIPRYLMPGARASTGGNYVAYETRNAEMDSLPMFGEDPGPPKIYQEDDDKFIFGPYTPPSPPKLKSVKGPLKIMQQTRWT
ncbi:MAG: hypothetical protein K2X77_18520 [Candidatus Obscuribacterales bacterium]|jgi:hypothetical protein|nr:hypothetical protein [Candidatus Obscuribacterales bacterium]